MEIYKLGLMGNANVGVFIYANDKVALVPPGITREEENTIQEALNVETVRIMIAGTFLHGILVVGNNNGIILPRNTNYEEIDVLSKLLKKYGLNVYLSGSRYTALGNMFLVNNKIGIASEEIEDSEINKISDTLGIEIIKKNIMGLPIPGSLAVINDSGGVIHPDVSDDEIKELEEILNIGLERSTVNAGIPFIKSGLVANNYGIIVGEITTGPEILRIKRGFEGAEK